MSRSVRALILLAGAIVLIWLVRRVGLATVLGLLREVGPAFVLVVALYALHIAFRAWALYRTLPDESVRLRDVLRARLAAEAIEMFTFTGPLFAEPAKGFLLTRRGLTTAAAFGGVATEYLLYSFVSACMAVVALSILLARHELPPSLRGGALAVVAGMAIFITGCAFAAATGNGLIGPLIGASGRLGGAARSARLASTFEPIESFMVAFLHTRPARLATVVAIEIAGHALLACEVWVIVAALGAHRSIGFAFVAEGAVKFIGTVFAFVPGQLGASEGSYVVIFRSLGLTDAVGLTVAVVRRLRSLLVAGICLGIVALSNDRQP